MFLRTRKHRLVLGFRIICVLSVTITFVVIGALSRHSQEPIASSANGDVSSQSFRRHLLAVSINNDTTTRSKTNTRSDTTTRSETASSNETIGNCTPPAITEFPSDGFTRVQRKQGWVLIHAILACYLFILLAIVCDDYFVPAIKKFCDILSMKKDIAGATFMAVASSSAELFINCIGTFVTEGDLGVGTVVGSAVFNILAVPACCGLFVNMVLELEWWALTRDSIMYGFSVLLLINVLQDGRIYLHEAVILVLAYSLYILLMCFNNALSNAAHKIIAKFRRKSYYTEIISETHPLLRRQENGKVFENSGVTDILDSELTLKDCQELEESTKVWEYPMEENAKGQIFWIFTWPISFILFITTPDCRKHPSLTPITFLMCILWIGSTSYVVAWLITIIGDTLNIPDSVMGLTFLAAGTSVPEAVSSIIVTNQGHGAMGVSSSIGSNTFDILLCLGIPWLIKAAFYPKVEGQNWIQINSNGINYSAISLFSTLVLLYLSIAFNKFRLDWRVGLACLLMYIGFLILASLIELNVFFEVNLPTCDH